MSGPSVRRASHPDPLINPVRRTIRYWVTRIVVSVIIRGYLRMHLVDRNRLPDGPAIYCFNHMSWADPFVLLAVFPFRPRLWLFGPREEDMSVGIRNRTMSWTGTAIPFKPGKNDLLDATRRVAAIIDSGGVVAIAGEGRIHVRESELLPLSEGPAYFAMRSGIPLVPIAISGTSWLRFGGRVMVRVGEPIVTGARPSRAAVIETTAALTAALAAMVADAPDIEPPGTIGTLVTERFNEWPEGSRDAARAASEESRLAYSGPPD